MDQCHCVNDVASLNAFANALWREWPQARLQHTAAGEMQLVLPLTQPGGTLHLPVRQASLAGRHRFDGRVLWQTSAGLQPLDFTRMVALLAAEPTLAPGSHHRTRRLFLRRVLDSAANIDRAESARVDAMTGLAWPQADYLAAEQGLIYGHAVHPTPKSRDEFTADDVVRYSPELAGRTSLAWFAVREEALWCSAVDGSDAKAQLQAVLQADPAMAAYCQRFAACDGWTLLPVHPWQANVLRQHAAYRHWLARGSLHDLGEAGGDWFPTSSLRTLYAPQAPAMLKFSLSVRLTNSRRVLQPAEVGRGRLIHAAFASSLGQRLQQQCPTLRILHETAALALAWPDGQPLAESFVILRDNPFRSGSTHYVMATLCQDGMQGMSSMVSRLVQTLAGQRGQALSEVTTQWFDRFLHCALTPFLIAQARYGFLFSAHAQNTVLAIEGGWPAGIWFRDCQGTTFRPETIAALAGEVPGIEAASELAFDENMTNRLFGYYLIVNTVFGLITALAADGCADERALLRQLRHHLVVLRREPLAYPHFIDYLLHSPQLMAKGNFMICLCDVNETTDAGASFRSYVPLSNPLSLPEVTGAHPA